jgi:hypothetical protein
MLTLHNAHYRAFLMTKKRGTSVSDPKVPLVGGLGGAHRVQRL